MILFIVSSLMSGHFSKTADFMRQAAEKQKEQKRACLPPASRECAGSWSRENTPAIPFRASLSRRL
jgi:hypothetical protein